MLGHYSLSLLARLSLHRTPLAYNKPSLGALDPCARPCFSGSAGQLPAEHRPSSLPADA